MCTYRILPLLIFFLVYALWKNFPVSVPQIATDIDCLGPLSGRAGPDGWKLWPVTSGWALLASFPQCPGDRSTCAVRGKELESTPPCVKERGKDHISILSQHIRLKDRGGCLLHTSSSDRLGCWSPER